MKVRYKRPNSWSVFVTLPNQSLSQNTFTGITIILIIYRRKDPWQREASNCLADTQSHKSKTVWGCLWNCISLMSEENASRRALWVCAVWNCAVCFSIRNRPWRGGLSNVLIRFNEWMNELSVNYQPKRFRLKLKLIIPALFLFLDCNHFYWIRFNQSKDQKK